MGRGWDGPGGRETVAGTTADRHSPGFTQLSCTITCRHAELTAPSLCGQHHLGSDEASGATDWLTASVPFSIIGPGMHNFTAAAQPFFAPNGDLSSRSLKPHVIYSIGSGEAQESRIEHAKVLHTLLQMIQLAASGLAQFATED